MNAEYYSLLTEVGQARIINAHALGKTVKLTMLKVGDGGEDGGKETSPKETDTHLVRVRWQGPINSIYQDEQNKNWLVSETVIPETDGNFYITEFGLYDDEDNLIVVGRYPKTYKPRLEQGSGSSLYLKVIFELSNTKTVELKIDPAIVLASRQYVDRSILAHEQKPDPHPQYVQKVVYDKEKWYTGIQDEPGTIHHGIFKGFVAKTSYHDDSPPSATGDFDTTDLGTNKNVYFHFITPININVDTGSHMFHIRIHGYAYGCAKIVDEVFCGHCYQKGRILYNPTTQGNCSPKIYTDKHGTVILSILIEDCQYTTLTIDSMTMAYKLKLAHGDIKCVLSLNDTIDSPA
ncbi:phage tail protein [Zooshikella sp. RANM57]|uniref:phage tail protein n=1 Tax=Zooshikella sp. RANM57 TaxID=3425863 RepID=UPI003D6F0A0F